MTKTIRNIAIVMILLTLVSYALVISIVSKASEVIENEKNKMEAYLGKKYLIDNDTVVVTDFSYVEGTFKIKFKDKTNDEVSIQYLKTLKEIK